MACFLVPATVAIITTLFAKKVPEQLHIWWFNIMVWGATGALLVEHIAHGEVTPWFPFLTAMSSPEATDEMLHEMLNIGVPMLLICVVVWLVMVYVYNKYTTPKNVNKASTA
ncbi:MAG: hypothetical protein WC248_02600 [Candidatus Methanomethylophilaceae archaeon]|jgi:hypothetical protein